MPSGRSISRESLNHLSRHPSQNHLLLRRLYDLSVEGKLTGAGHSINLAQVTTHTRLLTNDTADDFALNIALDGVALREVSTVLQRVFIRTGGGYSVIHNDNGVILSVHHVNGLHLVPVNVYKYPGLMLAATVPATITTNTSTLHQRSSTSRVQKNTVTHTTSRSVRNLGIACTPDAPTHVVDLAVAFDSAFCARYGGDYATTVSAARAAVAQADEPFARGTCLRLSVSNVYGHCTTHDDPYVGLRGLDSSSILAGFRDIWNSRFGNVHRDAAILLSGFVDSSQVAGSAYTGAACSAHYGYGWVELANGPILAHEIGHLVNAKHAHTGLMTAVVHPQAAMVFSQESIAEISTFVQQASASRSCLVRTVSSPQTGGSRGREQPQEQPRKRVWSNQTPTTTTKAPVTPTPTSRARRKKEKKRKRTSKENPWENLFTFPKFKPRDNSPQDRSGPSLRCESGFSPRHVMMCKTVKLGELVHKIGNVYVRLSQQYGRMDVIFQGGHGCKIHSYVRKLSIKGEIKPGNVSGKKKIVNGASTVKAKWNIGKMTRKSGQATCCGQPIYVYVWVRFCKKSDKNDEQTCADGSANLSTKVACGSCGNRQVMAMSKSRQCPRCT